MDWVKENKRILPKKEIIKLDNEKLQIDLYYNNLSSEQLAAAKQEIKSTFYNFKDQYEIKQYGTNKVLSIFLHDNKSDYDKYAYTKDEGMGQYSKCKTNFAYMYYYIHGDPEGSLRHQVSYALTYYNGKWDRNKILSDLKEEMIVDQPQYNLKVRVHYNDLNDNQLKATRQEIKKIFSDFDKSFGIEKSNSPLELQLYIYDNEHDFKKHTKKSAYGVAHPHWDGNNVAKMSIYKFDDEGTGFIPILRHELAHGLTFYCNGSSGLTCGKEASYGLASFLTEGIAHYIHQGSKLSQNSTFNPEEYYKDGRMLVYLFEDRHPEVINSILHKNKHYKNALKHFKAEFPDLVKHISDNESFPVYDEAFFKRIFHSNKVVQRFATNDFDEGNSKISYALCTKEGHTLSDYSNHAKIDNKYISAKAIDYDEEDIFSIKLDEVNLQEIKIFDTYGDEIGTLFNNYLS